MNKEECIALLIRYAEYDGMGIPNLDGCKEAMKMAADLLSQPSLPPNLDEAAQKDAIRTYVMPEDGDIDKIFDVLRARPFHEIGFKAGAEWWAGQGVTKEAVIGMETEDIFINVSGRTLDELDLCPGDKVVVQIRKK